MPGNPFLRRRGNEGAAQGNKIARQKDLETVQASVTTTAPEVVSSTPSTPEASAAAAAASATAAASWASAASTSATNAANSASNAASSATAAAGSATAAAGSASAASTSATNAASSASAAAASAAEAARNGGQARSAVLSLLTTGSPGDIGTIAMPAGLTRYALQRVWVVAVTASGSLALATLDVRTAAAGGGSSVLSSPITLSGLLSAGDVQKMDGADSLARTAATLYVRQTADTLNAGTVLVAVEFINLS